VDGDRRVTIRWWRRCVVVVVDQDLNDEEALALLMMAWCKFLIVAKAEALDATVCNLHRRQPLACGGFGGCRG
jgi:hypothetical protein